MRHSCTASRLQRHSNCNDLRVLLFSFYDIFVMLSCMVLQLQIHSCNAFIFYDIHVLFSICSNIPVQFSNRYVNPVLLSNCYSGVLLSKYYDIVYCFPLLQHSCTGTNFNDVRLLLSKCYGFVYCY